MVNYRLPAASYVEKTDMLDSLVFSYMMAAGLSDDEIVTSTLDEIGDEELAAICIDGWSLDDHMTVNGYTEQELTEAFYRFRINRPDRGK